MWGRRNERVVRRWGVDKLGRIGRDQYWKRGLCALRIVWGRRNERVLGRSAVI